MKMFYKYRACEIVVKLCRWWSKCTV